MQYKNSIYFSLDTPGIFFQDSCHIAVHRHTGPPSVSLTNKSDQPRISTANKDSHVRMRFISYSSVFNTIIPSTLTDKLLMLGLIPSLCSWIMDFLTSRTQSVSIGPLSSQTLIMHTVCPEGCVLSPPLYTLLTHDYTASYESNSIHQVCL